MNLYRLFFIGCAWCLTACSTDLPPDVEQAMKLLPETIDYNIHVKPILSDKCFSCHGPDKAKREAGLRLDDVHFATGPLPESPGKVAIKPGSPDGSELCRRILSSSPDVMMPTPESHLSLSAHEKAMLVKWIEDGAKYKPHWAFVKPEKPAVPAVKQKEWKVLSPIDNFIYERLQAEKMSPSKQAGKELLLRRLYLDMTGLPPTLEEMNDFLKDSSSLAYEKQVDRLLASPHYGEKMATDWLDVARFADSHGYTVDRLRDMSPYRDWVINAFNNNLPYDKFIQHQLSGDLMPSPTRDMIVATAFNRNHPQNMEGGIVEEEFQTEYVVDRTNTFGTAFLGLTVSCAKCHDHKYDPISQKNYYQLFSFFNNVKEAGQISWDDALPTPTLMLPTPEKERVVEFIKANIAEQNRRIDSLKQLSDKPFNDWIAGGSYKKTIETNIPKKGLVAYYPLDDLSVRNAVNPSLGGEYKRDRARFEGDPPVLTDGQKNKALLLNGDTWIDLKKVGVFRKSEPFSIGITVLVPKGFKEGVIFHKSVAERLYNFRGYHLYIRDNRFELNMAHTAPSNAITRISVDTVPTDKWIQLTVTYDGSSKASGLNLYMNGIRMQMETTMDQLTKDILFNGNDQPGLQIGAWSRGLGFKSGKVDEVFVYNRRLTDLEVLAIAQKPALVKMLNKNVNNLSQQEKSQLKDYYITVYDRSVQSAETNLQKLRTELSDSTENIPEIMVMQEMPKPKKTRVLVRGNYDAFGEEVFPATPESILRFPEKFSKNRYGLAQWLTLRDNPLTSRVAVNRIWQNFFGTGIVKTAEDFGNQGEMPSHPALLDWLAVDFVENGWDVKRLVKMIVLSATYRQDSYTSKEAAEKDPENRLLSHGPSKRMTAEMIRDNALLASGLLNKQIGGPSVKPYQPDGLWEINNTSYTRDTGQKIYRRSMYVVHKRSVPNPTLATFDASSRDYCVMRRQQTNTPLQALVTLNDPTFIEAAKVMGEKMAEEKNTTTAIINAYRKLTGQTPEKKIVDILKEMYFKEEQKFRDNPAKARGWLATGQYVIKRNLHPSVVAANAVVASTILNSDASLTKR